MQGDDSTSNSSTERAIEKFERLSVSNPNSSSTPLTHAAVKIRDALDYIETVKARFLEDEPEVYDEFLLLMKMFKNHFIDTTGVIRGIGQLFLEHPDLVAGFDDFLPPGYSTSSLTPAVETTEDEERDEGSDGSGTASPGEGSRSVTPTPGDIQKEGTGAKVSGEPTIAYIQRVKRRCDAETWEQFMVILSRQYDDPGSFDVEEMIKDVEELFEDHLELIPGFRTFLTEERQEKSSKSSGKRMSET